MAILKLYRFEILSTRGMTTNLSVGDVLEVFVDDAAVVVPSNNTIIGITVTLNGVNLPLGNYYILGDSRSDIARRSFNNDLFCSGTSLVVFEAHLNRWPFARYNSLENHFTCAITPNTCDLIIVGTAVVIDSSGETNSDGSIAVVATSSNAIEYSLTDFTYGSGQISNTFTGLLPGDYRVFLRDSANCSADILVTVGYSSGYAAIYTTEYNDFAGFSSKLEITKRGFVGVNTEVKGGGDTFSLELRGEGVTDKFFPFLFSEGNLLITAEIQDYFTDLYTNDRNLFRLNYYKDMGSGYNLKWTGKVLPFRYSAPYLAAPYHVSITATDSLSELNDFALSQKDGQNFFGTVKAIKLIAYCLGLLKLDLPIRVACNIYANTMVSAASDDPLDQAYIDYEAFYIADDDASAYLALDSILMAFRARITQWDGRWNIVRVEEMVDSYDYRDYDSLGDYVSNGTFDPVIDVDYPTANGFMFAEGSQAIETRPGYGFVRVNYSLGLKPNIIVNGDFRLISNYVANTDSYEFEINKYGFTLVSAGYPVTEGFERIESGNVAYSISAGEEITTNSSGGNAYLQSDKYEIKMGTNNQLKIIVVYKIAKYDLSGDVREIFLQRYPYVKLRIRVKYGSLYLQANGGWSTVDNTIDVLSTVYNEFVSYELLVNQPTSGTPTDGMDFDIRVYHAYPFFTKFQTLASLRAFDTVDGTDDTIPTGYRTELRDDFINPSLIYYYELEENTNVAIGYDLVRPDDYHATTNPRQWVRKEYGSVGSFYSDKTFYFSIDKIVVQFLTNQKESIDAVVRVANSELFNNDILEQDVILGSYSNLIVTEEIINKRIRIRTLTTSTILSADLIYTGYLRDSSGVGYEFWVRDGISELDKLHGIFLKTTSFQYNKSWKFLRASITSRGGIFGLLNIVNDVNDSNKKYLPISLTIKDRMAIVDGEFLELMEIGGGSDGSGSSPFSSGFTTGFGASGFN